MKNASLQKAADNSFLAGSAMMIVNVIMIFATTRNPTPAMVFWYMVVASLTVIATTASTTLATVRSVATGKDLGFAAMAWFGFAAAFLILLLALSELMFGHPFIKLY